MIKGRRLKVKIIYLLGFAIPMIVFASVLAIRGVHPFGNTALFSNDMDEQYIAFFGYYRRVLLHAPAGILYSFSNGLGGNMAGIWAYYLLSPFNLVLLLFPDTATATAVVVLTTLKIGFAGLFMTIFLVRKNNKVNRLLILLLSNSYALMSYVINYNSNIMWMDAIVLLPLLALGIEHIIDHNRAIFYSIILALVIIVNYYTAYMTSIFICIYFIWYLSLKKNVTFRTFISKSWLFVRASIIGGLISAIVEMPNLYALSQSKLQNQTSWSFNFLYNPLLLLVKTIGYYYDDRLPIVFVGSFALILFILYFCNSRISRRERAKTGIVTVILWLSASYDPMVITWHAFQQPIGYRYRFMFVIGFWIIVIAFRSLEALRRVSLRSVIGLIEFFVLVTIYGVLVRKQFTLLSNAALIGSLITDIMIAICLFYLHRNRRISVIGLMLLVILQLGINVYSSYKGIQLADNDKVSQYYHDLTADLKNIPVRSRQNSRVEKTFLRDSDKLNDSLQVGYNGGSVYSSTLQQSVARFYTMVGQPSHPSNMNYFLSYTNGTVPMDTILGFDYIMGQIGNHKKSVVKDNVVSRYDLKAYRRTAEYKNISIFHTGALPIAFVSKGDVASVKLNRSKPIQNQQKLVNSVLDNKTDYFKRLKLKVVDSKNMENQALKRGRLIRTLVNKKSWVDFSVNTDSKKLLYAELENRLLDKSKITTEAGKLLTFHTLIDDPVVFSIPNNKRNVTLRIEVNQDNLSLSDFKLFEFDNLHYQDALRKLKAKNSDNNIRIVQNRVTGTFKAEHEGDSLVLSIPYDKGWQLRVDGRKVKYKKTFEAFMSVKVKKGSHRFEMTYLPPFLKLGLIISMVGVTLLVFELFHERKRRSFWRGI